MFFSDGLTNDTSSLPKNHKRSPNTRHANLNPNTKNPPTALR